VIDSHPACIEELMTKIALGPILWIAVAALLGAVGQFLFKHASQSRSGFLSIMISPSAILGFACYLTVMGLFVHAFRRGGSVTVLYPIYASTFIWAAVIAWLFYQQPVRPIHVAGMVLLVSGMLLMGV
jgi:multidrug transporter EmrE-like cation transporter